MGAVRAHRCACVARGAHIPRSAITTVGLFWGDAAAEVQQMQPPYHEIRWLMVREARIEKKLLATEAYEYASKKLANTPARAKIDAIMKSFQKIESGLPPGLRLSPPRRPRQPRQPRVK